MEVTTSDTMDHGLGVWVVAAFRCTGSFASAAGRRCAARQPVRGSVYGHRPPALAGIRPRWSAAMDRSTNWLARLKANDRAFTWSDEGRGARRVLGGEFGLTHLATRLVPRCGGHVRRLRVGGAHLTGCRRVPLPRMYLNSAFRVFAWRSSLSILFSFSDAPDTPNKRTGDRRLSNQRAEGGGPSCAWEALGLDEPRFHRSGNEPAPRFGGCGTAARGTQPATAPRS